MNLDAKQKELIMLSKEYDLIYETRELSFVGSDDREQHILVWIPYICCDFILPLLIELSGTDWEDHCLAFLGSDSLCIDLTEMFEDADLDYQFIQALSGIKLKNCEGK